MRIGMVAPPWFELPPRGYGGIESMCYWLAEGLVARGHDVTLIGAGPRHTSARFVSTFDEPLTARIGEAYPEVIHLAEAARALEAADVDVVHDHTLAGVLLAFGRAAPTVVTAHGPVNGDASAYYRRLGRRISLVGISDRQRRSAPELPWVGTVYNGIPVDDYPFCDRKEDFILFLGRMSPEKGAPVAIDGLTYLVAAGNAPASKKGAATAENANPGAKTKGKKGEQRRVQGARQALRQCWIA